MYRCLSPGAVGVRVSSLEDALQAARTGWFEGLEANMGQVGRAVEELGVAGVQEMLLQTGIELGAFGLPLEWRAGEDLWKDGLQKLPAAARLAASLGCNRTATYILSGSDTLEFEANRRFHLERLKPVAEILAAEGCRFGLEFLGPKTLKDRFRFPFIAEMQGMLELAAEMGPNTGVLLDCWHWYTSHSTLAQIEALRPEQVVLVHVNDAPAGIAIDEQQDGVRELPARTGVIDIAGFLGALRSIGYHGPVIPEPFAKELNALPDDNARLKAAGEAMVRIMPGRG